MLAASRCSTQQVGYYSKSVALSRSASRIPSLRARAMEVSCGAQPCAASRRCPRCTYLCRLPRWLRLPWSQIPVAAAATGQAASSSSWLVERQQLCGGLRLWGFGCRVCNAAFLETRKAPIKVLPFAQLIVTRALTSNHLKRHSESAYHIAAASSSGMAAAVSACAPGLDAFQLVFAQVAERGQVVGTCGVSGAGGSKKARRMATCLAEAMFEKDRDFVLGAKTLTLLRDVRKGVVAIRFSAVSKDLQVRTGLLGVAKDLQRFGTGALGLLKTTSHVITCFSTFLPGTSCAQNVGSVRSAIRRRCHMVTVDAAADEVLASELMRQPLSQVFSALTPNLRIILRDKAHASRRTASGEAWAWNFDHATML